MYTRLLTTAVDRPGVVVLVAVVVLALTLGAVKLGVVKTELFPPSNSNYARFNVQTPTGTAISVTNDVTRQIELRMAKDPRVIAVGAQVGVAGFQGNGRAVTNEANLSVTLKPGISSADAARFVSQWQSAITGAPGRGARLSPEQIQTMRARFGAPIPGVVIFGRTVDIVQGTIARGQDAMQILVFGPDFQTLYNTAWNSVIPKIEQIPGVQSPDTNIALAQPEVDIKVDRTKATQLGLSTQTISNVIDTATAGSIASYLQINGTQYPIIVQLPASERRSLQAVQSLNIPLGSNTTALSSALSQSSSVSGAGASASLATLPLGELANISFGSGPSEITRVNKARDIEIDAGVNGVPLGDAVAQATTIMNSITLPPGYHWGFGQSVTQQSDTFGSLGLIVILAIVLIYMLLAAQFESLLHPLVIMCSVPLSFAGIVVALVVTQRSFGLTAFIGVLMLVGIVVKNAILVVEFTNQLRERGYAPREAVLHAAPLRLRPILMTTLASIGGMIPIAIGIEAGSQTQAPLGTVVIGGLLFSTMLSLIVVPTLYLWVARNIEPRMGGFRGSRNGRAKAISTGSVPVEV